MPTIAVNGTDASDLGSHAIAGPTGGADGLASQLGRLVAGSSNATADPSAQRLIPVLGQHIRVSVRNGSGVPLVLCNGIGASLEVLDPLVDQLDPDTTVIRFDARVSAGPRIRDCPIAFRTWRRCLADC